jgi:Matrixin
MPPPQLLRMESLEHRDTPSTVGTLWSDPSALTLSFAPDDTPIGADKSDLFNVMKKVGKTEVWQREVLRAFQTWAVQTNANIAVVADGRQPFGASGERQGDNRFGDIRIGATALSADSLANAVPNDPGVGTWSGDLLFNSLKRFAVNPTASSNGYDVFSVALHEAGHVFGLDHSSVSGSAMSEAYTGAKAGVSAGDVANLRAVYGVRPADRYEGAAGNGTIQTATALSSSLYQVLTGDLTTVGDVDVFSFTVAAGSDGGTLTLRTGGVSSVSASIAIYDASGRLVAQSGVTNPLRARDLTLDVPGSRSDARYYARVSSPNSDVFAIGRYLLSLNMVSTDDDDDDGKATPVLTTSDPTTSSKPIVDRGTNETLSTATLMSPWSHEKDDRFRTDARLEKRTDVDTYRVIAPTVAVSDALQVQIRNLRGDRIAPEVRVFDATGHPLMAQLLESNGSKTTFQILGITRGASYFVTIRSPNGVDASGDYRLIADFTEPVHRGLTHLDGGAVSSALPESSGTLEVESTRLFQFALNVASDFLNTASVELQLFDENDRLLTSWAVNPQTGQLNGSVVLSAGQYRVAVVLESKKGQVVPPVQYWLYAGVSSDPIGPTATSTSTLGGTTTSPPTSPPPPSYTYTGSTTTVPVGYPYRS